MKGTTSLTLPMLKAVCKVVTVSYNRCSKMIAINITASEFTDMSIMSNKSGYGQLDVYIRGNSAISKKGVTDDMIAHPHNGP